MNYQLGLRRLLTQLQQNSPSYDEVLQYEAGFLKILESEQSTEKQAIATAEQLSIIERLNRLSLSELGVSFNDLCREEVEPSQLQEDLLKIIKQPKPIDELQQAIEDKQLNEVISLLETTADDVRELAKPTGPIGKSSPPPALGRVSEVVETLRHLNSTLDKLESWLKQDEIYQKLGGELLKEIDVSEKYLKNCTSNFYAYYQWRENQQHDVNLSYDVTQFYEKNRLDAAEDMRRFARSIWRVVQSLRDRVNEAKV